MSFQALLDRFAAAVGAHDSPGLAALFAENGCYDDYFFGEHHGRAEIAEMLDRFHVGGEQFCWQFTDPVFADGVGYASYCFSYLSREPESAGRLMMFADDRRRDDRLRDSTQASATCARGTPRAPPPRPPPRPPCGPASTGRRRTACGRSRRSRARAVCRSSRG
jgi:hypothetical protein